MTQNTINRRNGRDEPLCAAYGCPHEPDMTVRYPNGEFRDYCEHTIREIRAIAPVEFTIVRRWS